MFLDEGDFVLFFVIFFLSLQDALNAQDTLCISFQNVMPKNFL